MFLKYSVAIVAAASLIGCASVPMGDVKRDTELKSFTAKPGVAGLDMYRNETLGAAVKMGLEVDGKPIGQSAAKTYFYKEVSPGKHTVTSTAENKDSLEIETVAGKLYYVCQEVKMGLLSARTRLQLMSEEEGRKEGRA